MKKLPKIDRFGYRRDPNRKSDNKLADLVFGRNSNHSTKKKKK